MAGESLLREGAIEGSISKIQKAIEQGVDLNEAIGSVDPTTWGYRAIHFAAKYGKTEVIPFLVSKGADVNITNTGGATALHTAIYRQSENSKNLVDTVQMLLFCGADPSIKEPHWGNTPLHHAIQFCEDATVIKEIVTILLLYGIDLNVINKNGLAAKALAETLNKESLFLTLSEKNWTAIYVWVSTASDKDPRGSMTNPFKGQIKGGSIGHIAMQTPDDYISFWPEKEVKLPEVTWSPSVSGQFMFSLYQDEVSKGRKADYAIVLYSLDTRAIYNAYREIKRSPTAEQWTLFGRNICNVFNAGKGQSCSGLVYDLLNFGRIKKRLNVNFDPIRDNVVTTPNNILDMVVTAKYSEMEKHPETKNFRLPFKETMPLPPKSKDYKSMTQEEIKEFDDFDYQQAFGHR